MCKLLLLLFFFFHLTPLTIKALFGKGRALGRATTLWGKQWGGQRPPGEGREGKLLQGRAPSPGEGTCAPWFLNNSY